MNNSTLSMNTRCFLKFAPIFFLLLFINFSSLNAQVVVASDNASNSAYSTGWNDGTNGGTGFGAWSISIGANTGRFIGSPAGDGMGTTGIGTSAFAFFASGSQFINATRSFNNAMQVGDVFTFYWATNFDPNGGGKGIDLRDASNNNIITLTHSGTSSSITFSGAASGTISTTYGTSPMLITVTRTSTTQYSISVTRRLTSEGTFSSTFSSSAAISRINLFHGNTNNTAGQRNPYFNNFQITSSAPTINVSSGVAASSPGSGTSGYAGNTVTINGQNLNTVTTARVGGSGGTAVAITGQTATSLTFTAPNIGGQIYLENPSGNTTSTESYTNLGFISTSSGGNWSSTGTWLGASVPTTGSAVTIAHNVTQDQNATVSSITINSSRTLTASANTLTISNNSNATTFSNSGTLTASGTHSVIFAGTGTHSISGTQSFQNVTTSTGLNFGSNSTITGSFQIDGGGFVSTNAPTYGSSSTLFYNSSGTYGRGPEWNATTGAGYPANVQVSNSTTVNMGANSGSAVARQCAGNLTVDALSVFSLNVTAMTAAVTVNGNVSNSGTITLSSQNGGDLVVRGNITDNGTFNSNNRAVFFSGSNVQDIQGSGVFDIAYVRINKTGGRVRMLSNLTCQGPNGGNAMELNSATSILDLNGFTLNLGQASSASTFNSGVATPGFLRSSSSSTLNIFGTGALGTINFDQSTPDTTNALQNLTINRTSTGAVTMGNTVRVGGAFTITAGTVGLTGSSSTANSLTVGTLGTQNTTWGSTSSSAARKDNSFFSGLGLLTVSNDTRTTPSVTTPPNATAIAFGQTLASSTLSGGSASVPGAFSFTTPATAPAAGTASQPVTFTPTNTANYNTATTTASVTVSDVTTWNGSSWSFGTPTSLLDATINAAYSTGAVAPQGPFPAKSLTITASGTLTIATGTNVTVQNAVTNNGTLTIENNANLRQVNNVANTGSGTTTVNRNGSTLKRLDFTLWSSPVTSAQTLLNFSPLTVTPRFYRYNETSNLFTAVVPSATSFTAGRSFFIRMPDVFPANSGNQTAYYLGNATLAYAGAFTGTLNNGDIPVTLTKLGTGYQALGNPYPSVINAQAFVTANTANIENTLYFWRKTNGAATAYATWTSGGATSTTLTSGTPNGTIQVGQGFIVQAKNAVTVSNFFNNTMRDAAPSSTQFFKVKQQAQKDRVWLNLTGADDVFSQALVAYVADGSLGLDQYDGKYINDSDIALTTSIAGDEYTIQGRPAFDATDVVSLNFKTSVAGTYTIAIDHVDGLFSKGQDVYLVDKKIGTTTNLNEGAYNFTAEAGVDNTRFTLTYQKTLKVDAPLFNENSVLVSKSNGTINVKSSAVAINNVKVFDIQGRLVAERKNVKSNTASITNVRASQVLIVKVTAENNAVVTKKVLN